MQKEKKVKEKKVIVPGKNETIFLWRDDAKINELQNKLNEILPFADKVVKAYHLLEFADEKADFYNLLSNTESRAKAHLRKVITENTTIPGVEIDTTAMINNGTYKPAGMADFSKALDQFLSAGGMNYHTYFKHVEKAVVIDPAVWQKFVDLHTIAAISPKEIELYNKWLHFLTNINEFATFMKQSHDIMILPVPLGPVIIGLIARLNSDNQLIINKDAFQMITKKLRNKTE